MSTYKARKKEALRKGISSAKLLTTSALTAASILALSAGTAMADNAWVLDQVGGSFDTDISVDNVTTITQNSSRAIGEGNLDIANYQTVNIKQNSKSDLFVARDNRSDPTRILGSLNSNGRVMVIDTNGIFFGTGSTVNVGAIIASTSDISNDAIMKGGDSFEFSDFGDGAITLEGTINVADAGLAAFVSPNVSNSGVINAKLGTVAFAAGETVTLDLYGDGLVEIAVDGELADALLETTGEINAEGGRVQMTAVAAKDAVDNIINVDGIVTVASAEVQGGKIILSGGKSGNVAVAGKLDASGTTGGSIDVSGENVTVAEGTELYADGGKGVDQKGAGGSIDVIANNHLDFRGSLFARGGALGGDGGNAEVSGYNFLGYQGYADLSAEKGSLGTLLMDPAFAVIHSGAIHNPLGQGYVLASWALANSMRNANVVVQADNFIDVGTRIDSYNTGNALVDGILNALVGTGDIDLSTWNFFIFSGTTNGNITFQSDEVNFNKDVIMGNGSLGVDAMTVNLDSRIYDKDGVTALGDARLFSNADLVNVLSNNALIQQGIYLSNDAGGATVHVDADTYTEDLVIDRSLKLEGADGATLQSNGGANLITVTASNVSIDPFVFDGLGLADYGISATGADNLVVDGNTFTDFNLDAIRVANSDNIQIINNDILLTGGNGVAVVGGNNAFIDNNEITGAALNAISLDGTKGSVVSNNVTSGGVSGVLVFNSEDAKVHDNDISNTVRGVDADMAKNIQIFDNDISGTTAFGIRVVNSDGTGYDGSGKDVDIWGNTVSSAGGTGIYVENSAYATVGPHPTNPFASGFAGGNVVSGGDAGIVIVNSDNAYVAYNTVDSVNGNGISVSGGSDVSVLTNKVGTTGGVDNIAGEGILIANSAGALVQGNEVSETGENGIKLQSSDDSLVQGNIVSNTGHNGIAVLGSNNVQVNLLNVVSNTHSAGITLNGSTNSVVDGNDISNTGGSGVWIKDANGSDVLNNLINTTWQNAARSTGSGVHVISSDDVTVSGNTIDNVTRGGDAIYAEMSDDLTVSGNFIGENGGDISGNGIAVHGGEDTTISGNRLTDVAADGIFVSGVTGVDILSNLIYGTADQSIFNFFGPNSTYGAGRDGIHVEDSYGIVIDGNTVQGDSAFFMKSGLGAGRHGIYVSGDQGILFGDGAQITNNYILGDSGLFHSSYSVGGDGIHVVNNNGGLFGARTEISGNQVSMTGGNGIYGSALYGALVDNNNIYQAHLNGIYLTGSHFADITNNDVMMSSENGIKVANSFNADIEYNTISRAGDDGIDVENSNYADIRGNTIDRTGDDGIDVEDSEGVDIVGNTISRTDGDGIEVRRSASADIFGNTISRADDDGIDVADSSNVEIGGNDIYNTGDNGIQVSNSYNADIRYNDIDETDGHGIYVSSSAYADIYGNDINRHYYGADTHGDGIYVYSSYGTDIYGNDVDDTWGNGIYVRNSDRSSVNWNDIQDAGENGIYISNSDYADVMHNDINNVDEHGIKVNPSDYVDIAYNTIHDAGWDGIRVDNGRYADIHGNHIHRVGDDGIDVNGNRGVDIYGNDIDRTGLAWWSYDGDGIEVSDSYDADIRYNRVENAGDDGIDVENSAYADIRNNRVYSSGDDGIDVEGSYKVDINDNMIVGARDNGIEVSNSYDADILGNNISWVRGDGIYAYNIERGDIRGNMIDHTGDDGIDVRESDYVDVNNNRVSNTDGDGIQLRSSRYADIRNNSVRFADDDGIDVENSSFVDITGNNVFGVRRNGIEVSDGYQADLFGNRVSFAGGDGINLRNVLYSNITGNRIGFVGDDGIDVRNGEHTAIRYNTIRFAGDDGIRVDDVHGYYHGGQDVLIRGNRVDRVWDDGIEVSNSGSTRIDGYNIVTNVGDNGILVTDPVGYHYAFPYIINNIAPPGPFGFPYESADVVIVDNVVNNAGGNGIAVEAYDVNLSVERNMISDSGENGIFLYAKGGFGGPVQTFSLIPVLGEFNSYIADNMVINSGANGLYVAGAGHNDVVVEGNTFQNNPVGARFESGNIDLTGRTNNIIVDTDYVLPSGYDYVTGLQFAPIAMFYQTLKVAFAPIPPSYSNLTLVDNTLGTTSFSGFINRAVGDAYYVRLEDGAFVNSSGGPIIIDGTFASWDGLVPNSFGNLLAPSVLQDLEDRIFDVDDVFGRGNIFVGNPIGLENIEDFFNQFAGFSAGSNSINVTLLGLPSTGFGPVNFANIAPAAGGNDNDPQNLANIEPAAGGDDVSCWGDAVNAAGGGTSANFNFGGTFEDSLAAAGACQAQTF